MIPIKVKRLIKEGFSDIKDFGFNIGFAKQKCILFNESLESLQHKNALILKKLKTDYADLLNNYKDQKESSEFKDNSPIWILWWNGDMPNILKMCHNSRINNSGKHPIIFLNKENIHNYVSFPDYVWQQFESGKIRIQHLADMIRVQLIRIHGGLWLDASIYCNDYIPDNIFNLPLFSIKGDPDPRFISNNRWTTFAIGGFANNVLCSFLDDFFQEYCRREKRFIDYFMFDCAIALAYENIPAVKKSIDDIPILQGDCYLLDKRLEQPYTDYKFPLFSKIAWSRFNNAPPLKGSLYEYLLHKEGVI